MKLCVGAVSRYVVEEAAKLKVPQIVASRRQVNATGGYTGYTQRSLVETVRALSNGFTAVVRDHGGPGQGGFDDDGIDEFDLDVAAGFDAIHIDVSALPRPEQPKTLESLLRRYRADVAVEIGGERDEQGWLDVLLGTALDEGVLPSYAVLDVGGHAHADRQCGTPRSVEWVELQTRRYNFLGTKTKAHNMDWMGGRSRYVGYLDAYNVAPEYAAVEIDAWLQVMSFEDGQALLSYAAALNLGKRWFNPGEGTPFERARCDARYVLNHDVVKELMAHVPAEGRVFVRQRVHDALVEGM